jgi:hypothetical protein
MKTYLRSTYVQHYCLNNLAFCHVHKEILDAIDIHKVMKEIALANNTCAAVFGHTDSLPLY